MQPGCASPEARDGRRFDLEEGGLLQSQAEGAEPTTHRRQPTAEQPTSLWKKELSLKKSPEAETGTEAEPVVEETPADEPVTDEPVAAEHVPGTVPGTGPDEPVWKKEVSFSRKASPDEPVAEEHVPAEHVARDSP